MKKIYFLLAFFLSSITGAHAATFRTGTYDLSGGNHQWSSSGYQGQVIITPQGENYSVVWKIGTKQSQVGIGILRDHIFSVAFTDLDNPSLWGIASYRVNREGELEGIWTSYDGTNSRPEYLFWKSHATY